MTPPGRNMKSKRNLLGKRERGREKRCRENKSEKRLVKEERKYWKGHVSHTWSYTYIFKYLRNQWAEKHVESNPIQLKFRAWLRGVYSTHPYSLGSTLFLWIRVVTVHISNPYLFESCLLNFFATQWKVVFFSLSKKIIDCCVAFFCQTRAEALIETG